MRALLAVSSFVMAVAACSSPDKASGATETNVAPAPCTSDEECPSGRCLNDPNVEAGGAGPGWCEQLGAGASTR